MRAERRNRSRRFRLLLGILFAFVVIYLLEVGLRIGGVAPAYQSGASGSWRMTPNLDASALRGPRDGHDFTVSTNADGLRTKLPRERTPGIPRVAVMGDSTVFGWGVSDGESVADGLQAALDAELPAEQSAGLAGRVEVLNAGQPGYSTTQAAWLFDEVVKAYTPDRVIVFVPMHDFNQVLVSDREVLEGGATLAARTRILLASNSRVYQLLRQALWAGAEEASLLPQQTTGEPRVERVSDAERARGFDAMRATLAGWGGELLIGFLPFHADLVGRGGDRIGVPWALAYGKAHDVAIVDVRACCGPDGAALVLADDRGHLSAEGNRRVGASMAPAVRASLGVVASTAGAP